MGMGCTRVTKRVLAALGKSSGGAPAQFVPVVDVTHGGVLWALPALLSNGLLRHTKDHFSLPNGFYSIVHILMLLAFMALSRIKSIEKLRYSSAGELGLPLGLDRIPEVRTLRQKIKHLAITGQVKEWGATLSKEWMEDDPEAAGTLYIDGHVRVYHGKNKLPKRYVSRQKLCMRGMSDYWLNDQQGRPFFVVSTPFTDGLIDMLRSEIVPRLLQEVPNQPSQQKLQENPYLARFLLVFDREGYSPVFFKEMWENHRIACMTYNKYPKSDWPEHEFSEQTEVGPQGQEITMKLAERGTLIGTKGKGLWVREMRKLTESGHQSAIICTEYHAETHPLAIRMFSRWCQENFFRYMLQHFGLESIIGYETEPIDETKTVVNPEYRKIQASIKSKAGKLGRKHCEFGKKTLSPTPPPEEIQEYEAQQGREIEEIDLLKKDLEALKKKRKEIDKHIAVSKLPEADRFSVLAPRRKAFIDTIKMIVYRAETAMYIILREFMARPDDARSLLRDIYTQTADIIPDEEQKTLTVRLHHLTNRMSDDAARQLAQHLNDTETVYPGTDLLMRYELVSG